MKKIKRSPLHITKVEDKVKKRLQKRCKQLDIKQWEYIESVLRDALDKPIKGIKYGYETSY